MSSFVFGVYPTRSIKRSSLMRFLPLKQILIYLFKSFWTFETGPKLFRLYPNFNDNKKFFLDFIRVVYLYLIATKHT